MSPNGFERIVFLSVSHHSGVARVTVTVTVTVTVNTEGVLEKQFFGDSGGGSVPQWGP